MREHYGRKTIESVLLPIVRDKVVTETELLKKMPVTVLNMSFHTLVACGFPIRRKTLDNCGTAKGTRGARRYVNHRVIIYYLE